ncbi:AbrB/MazE/SpoVT family DNA-binding domain-containing protein [Roseomonas sp. CCTCC AB2023176]|uniref:AbrB/MazE/SpoVT family DNA-binding domain-containing protein n=1 Tax=Roseomonas sp. CCTCC AB2023176 TaxID=3342640 RepID=UPI0035DE0321
MAANASASAGNADGVIATTVTTKGQVTIPKPTRDHLGIVPGTAVTFDVEGDGPVALRPAKAEDRPENRFARWRVAAGPGLSTDEIKRLLRDDD